MTGFLGNVVRLLRGSLAGQLIVFLSLPIISRLYSPETFGIVQATLSLLTLLTIVSSLRLEVATLSVPEAELDDLVRCAGFLSVLTALLALVAVLAVQAIWQIWTNAQLALVILLPLLGVFAGWNQLLSYLALRRQAFGISSNLKIAQSAAQSASTISLGLLHPTSMSMMVGDAMGRLGGAIYLVRALKLPVRTWSSKRLSGAGKILTAHRELVTVGLMAALINAAGSTFTSVMLLGLFAAADAGQYAMVERFVGVPIGLISMTVSQVFMAKLASSITEGNESMALAIFRRLLKFQVAGGFILAALLIFIVPKLLPLILGKQWESAGKLLQPLTLLYFFSFVASPVNMTLTILGKQRLQLLWDCGRFFVVNGTWLVVWYLHIDMMAALWAFAVAAAVCYIAYIFIADHALAQGQASA